MPTRGQEDRGASALARGDVDGDGGAAGGRPGEPPVDAGGVERVRACRHGAPPLPGARGLEAHGARGGVGGLVAAAGEGEAWEEADVGGREPRAERRRRRGRRVERRDTVAATAVVAEGARGEDEDEEEQGGRGGEEDEDRERGRHHGRLHGERQEARAGALAVPPDGTAYWLLFPVPGRAHRARRRRLERVRPFELVMRWPASPLAWLGRSAVRGGIEWNIQRGSVERRELEGLPNLELWPRSVRWRVAVSSTVM